MSILIKGMDMPKSCNECFAQQHIPAGIDHYPFDYCVFENWQLSRTPLTLTEKELKSRPSYCPLVPVPPHGDLIDRNALEKGDRPIGKIMMFGGEYVYTQTEIDNAPTIIEAEEGE